MSTFDLFRHDFVLSIRPEYATKIMSGEKTVELRRRFPGGTVTGARAYIYATAPIQGIIGWATIADVKSMSPKEIWAKYQAVACIGAEDFWQYFADVESGFVLELIDVVAPPAPIGLSALKAHLNFVPPQSYCYADDTLRRLVQHA
jgi:predicted transcriptional regulator